MASELLQQVARCGALLEDLNLAADKELGPSTEEEEWAQEFKQRKFMFLAVEAQRHFMRMQESGDVSGEALERMFCQLSAEEEVLGEELLLELEEHLRLSEELANTRRDALERYRLCQEELEDLRISAQEEQDEEESAGARLMAKRLRTSSIPDDEEGLVQELVKSEAAEAEEIARLERLAAFEADLGLPRIQFFERDGLILLSRPQLHSLESASRAGALPSEGSSSHISAKAQWDATGRLLCIEPPPSLCLQFEAASAVASGDLGRLLALMWDRASQCRQGQLEDVAPSC